jgi:hypothetical protein
MFPGNRNGYSPWTSGATDYGAHLTTGNGFRNAAQNGSKIDPHPFFGGRYVYGGRNEKGQYQNGVKGAGCMLPNGKVSPAMVQDGLSRTLLLGEMQRLWDDSSTTWTDTHGPWGRRSTDGWAVGGASNLFCTDRIPDHVAKSGGLNRPHFESPGSDHLEGAHLSLADGSVRFFSAWVNPAILRDLGSRAGGETTQVPQ